MKVTACDTGANDIRNKYKEDTADEDEALNNNSRSV